MRVRVASSDGLLFWVGEDSTLHGRRGDRLDVGINDGYLELSYDLGSGSGLVRWNRSRIDDQVWHTIQVQRCVYTLELNNLAHHLRPEIGV